MAPEPHVQSSSDDHRWKQAAQDEIAKIERIPFSRGAQDSIHDWHTKHDPISAAAAVQDWNKTKRREVPWKISSDDDSMPDLIDDTIQVPKSTVPTEDDFEDLASIIDETKSLKFNMMAAEEEHRDQYPGDYLRARRISDWNTNLNQFLEQIGEGVTSWSLYDDVQFRDKERSYPRDWIFVLFV